MKHIKAILGIALVVLAIITLAVPALAVIISTVGDFIGLNK